MGQSSIKTVAVVGLGLIGGSLAKAIRRSHPSWRITATDIEEKHITMALEEGVIDEGTTNFEDIVRQANIIFLCAPVGAIPTLLKQVAACASDGAIITDTGSTKEYIVRTAMECLPPNIFFIGGHPMAGTEHSGYAASIPHLFENAYYILTPLPSTPDQAVKSLKDLLSSIGAIPLVMEPQLHDKIVGAISHLPHVVASALVNAVQDIDEPQHLKERLAAGGFRDITRIASSNPKMWRDISISNRQQLLELIDSIIQHLDKFCRYLNEGNADKIEEFFSRAKRFRDSIPRLQSQASSLYHDLYVDVPDRPGVIGEIASLLGQHSINIKNLRIINSREDEPGGCLVLSLQNAASLRKAKEVLDAQGYKTYAK
ncbi:prephenate dehydrogenase [Caldicoprobacter guelmensis]|uniref:prephenate dehydrogenase n=1 Tax=Caldicoprobacter guelmensis TaxID=1170224 RepID=UPI00195816D4|nr:prephenate dehydrogenase [Caldicoprobacter guelmensis]MBM7581698.1 prephenate dehydrogenase [Caldicoprobacter guelmensis]